MQSNLAFLEDVLTELEIPMPGAASLAGHAAGLPFEQRVHEQILRRYPDRTFRHFELLNQLLLRNSAATTAFERARLFGSEEVRKLLSRGSQAMQAWRPDNQFDEKQNDTADSIICSRSDLDLLRSSVHLVDVKSTDIAKNGQPPNIISAQKIADACVGMLEAEEYDRFSVTYVGVRYQRRADALVAEKVVVRDLFKIPPDSLYINWVAAQQIQMHVDKASDGYTGDVALWAEDYLAHYVRSARRRIAKQETALKKYDQWS